MNLPCDFNVSMFFFPCERQESVALGGILIVHSLQEGKHEYTVENVVKYQKLRGARTFARYVMMLRRTIDQTVLIV